MNSQRINPRPSAYIILTIASYTQSMENLANAARRFHEHDIPILGINMGGVGFLADIKTDNFEGIINDIVNGNFDIDERLAQLTSSLIQNLHESQKISASLLKRLEE